MAGGVAWDPEGNTRPASQACDLSRIPFLACDSDNSVTNILYGK